MHQIVLRTQRNGAFETLSRLIEFALLKVSHAERRMRNREIWIERHRLLQIVEGVQAMAMQQQISEATLRFCFGERRGLGCRVDVELFLEVPAKDVIAILLDVITELFLHCFIRHPKRLLKQWRKSSVIT